MLTHIVAGVRVQGLSYNPFARQVHVDNTETSVIEKIRSVTEMKADYHLSGRAQIINIWRPVSENTLQLNPETRFIIITDLEYGEE